MLRKIKKTFDLKIERRIEQCVRIDLTRKGSFLIVKDSRTFYTKRRKTIHGSLSHSQFQMVLLSYISSGEDFIDCIGSLKVVPVGCVPVVFVVRIVQVEMGHTVGLVDIKEQQLGPLVFET